MGRDLGLISNIIRVISTHVPTSDSGPRLNTVIGHGPGVILLGGDSITSSTTADE